MRLMNNQRGTFSFPFDGISHRRFEKKNQVSRFSNLKEDMKISINKGTKSMWITKKPFMGFFTNIT